MTSRRFKSNFSSILISFLISGLILQGVLPTFSYAASTITSDGTMGTTVSQAGTIYNINGGTIKGTNQFQSFGLFGVGTGDTASFNGPPVILNIIGRVTGGQQSVIDGILKSTITGANLYLLNPYGVLFGKNATLNVSGSFHVSTADYLRFSDGARFYANLSNNSTLSSAPISAFGFLSNNPAPITIQESSLQVPKGKALSLVGGDINITNNTPGYLWAPSGQINLVSVASPGEVNLSDFSTNSFSKLGNITIFQPSWNSGGIYADGGDYNVDPGGAIIIRGGQIFFENTNLNARGNPGGTLSIKGEQLHLDDTYISTETRGAVNHPGTGVDINVTGDVLLTNGSEIASSSFGAGRAGDIRITAGNIQLGDDDPAKSLYASIGFYGDLGSRAFGSGRSGDVYITADNLTVKNGFFIDTEALSWGDAGNVTVHANSLKLLDEGSIGSIGFGVGKGGIVDVIATNVLISGKNDPNVPNYTGLTGLAAQTGYWSTGGLLKVTADNLQILDAGSISTTLFSVGPGANIEITAKNILISGVVIDNRISPSDVHASIDARVIGSYASGTGGNISVVSDSLQVTNGGFIASGLFGDAPGNAGNITINTGSLEVSDRGGIFASSVYGTGNAGRLDITAKDVSILGVKNSPDPFGKDFTGFSTATNARLGGDLRVTADNLVVKDVGSISAASVGSGHAGNIEVNVGNVQVLDGATITSGAFSSGDAGNLDIRSNNLLLANTGSISAGSAGSGHAGNIEVNVGNVQVLDGAAIVSSAFGSGDGGSINVKANNVLVSGVNPGPYVDMAGIHPSGIASQAFINGGNAGDVQITAGSLQVLDGARISTETFGRGNGGTIQITADNVLISGVNQGVKEFLTANGADPEGASASLLTSTNGSFLGSGATGNAGNLRITVRNVQVQDGGMISSKTDTSGNGGNIELTVDRMNLFNGATVSAESSGAGYAGNISIKATDTLLVKDSSITTEAKYTDGGNIQVNAGYMVELIGSKITASVGGGPETIGGNITIDPHYVILNDSQIIANAYEGKGGNIRIIADVFLASPESVVDASSALGIDGTVDIRAPISNISGTLAPVQGNFLSTEALLRDRCAARIRGEKYSSFVVSGRDGLPIRPGSVLPSPIY